ncbi:MAG: hypothetical protein DSZ10_05245 [Sulfurovum sp.]|nr:MAG: hypothetical protein DSZ10_05245 [Sulfurovum sp.]
MKKASLILSHLGNLPQFKVLKQQQCYKKFLSLLSPKWQKAIAFVYIRNQTLFIALAHPGFKMELNYNRDLLKSLLTQLSTLDKECHWMEADKIAIFHSKFRPVQQIDKSTIPFYHEHATESFTVKTEDAEIREKFENLKRAIWANRQANRP